MEVEDEEDSATGEDSDHEEEASVTEEDSVTEDEGDSEEVEAEDSAPRRVVDFVAEGVEEEPREAEEDRGAVAEEALEQGGRSWLSHTDMKECLSAEGRKMPW